MNARRMLAVLLAAAALAAPVSAGPLVDSLKKRQAEIDGILARNPGELPAPERKALEQALATAFDFEAMGRSALAAEWENRTAPERTAYDGATGNDEHGRLLREALVARGVDATHVITREATNQFAVIILDETSPRSRQVYMKVIS